MESSTASSTSASTTSSSSLGNFQIGSLKYYNGNLYVGTQSKILKIDSSANISTYLGLGGEIDIDIDIVGESDFITGLQFGANGEMYFGGVVWGKFVMRLGFSALMRSYGCAAVPCPQG